MLTHILESPSETDGYHGHLQSLTLNLEANLIKNERGGTAAARLTNIPDYHLRTGNNVGVGAAWCKVSKPAASDGPGLPSGKARHGAKATGTGAAGRHYLSVLIDDPSLPAPIHARLIGGDDSVHRLYWSRSQAE